MSNYREIGDRVFSITIQSKYDVDEHNRLRIEKYENWEEAKQIRIMENCDNYYGIDYSKEEAIALFEDIIAWLKENAIDGF